MRICRGRAEELCYQQPSPVCVGLLMGGEPKRSQAMAGTGALHGAVLRERAQRHCWKSLLVQWGPAGCTLSQYRNALCLQICFSREEAVYRGSVLHVILFLFGFWFFVWLGLVLFVGLFVCFVTCPAKICFLGSVPWLAQAGVAALVALKLFRL